VKLSVIIAAHNAASTIGQQLEALATQKWSEPWEVVVVDNRSTDNTAEVVSRFEGRIPVLRVIEASERAGAAYAANVGVRHTTGESLAFCDSDDIVADGWVAAMGEALAQNEFVAGPLETARLNTGKLSRYRRNPQASGIQQYTNPPYLPHAAGANLGIRRALFDRLGGFEESMMALQDTDLCWRVQLAGVKLVSARDAIVHYRFRDTVSGLLRQAFTYAYYNVVIYKKYRAYGMPKLALKPGIRSWISLVLGVKRLMRPETRVQWLWQAGWLSGRLYASVKNRVLAL
jgi:GT2 family glycosyltransferase